MSASTKSNIESKYHFIGFISSGTYGRVYRAKGQNGVVGDFAIKKFKPDKEGERAYTGISQSAIREMAICAEVNHPNLIKHVETILEDKAIFMVFQYCEHDLLQIVHRHSQTINKPIPPTTIKSIMYQLLKGCQYLHTNWIMHRDLKPANIMVTHEGQVMIGDLGLARIFREPLIALWSGDKVVVTIWYRAPELLMGAHHYTPAIDLWAIGCIFAELLNLRPIFKGEEAKMDNKKTVPFQKHQMQKIMEVLGRPNLDGNWPSFASYPDAERAKLAEICAGTRKYEVSGGLRTWYNSALKAYKTYQPEELPGEDGFDLLSGLLTYDPLRRMTAAQALAHPYFATAPPDDNCFKGSSIEYPGRKIAPDEHHAGGSGPGSKRTARGDDTAGGARPTKRLREV